MARFEKISKYVDDTTINLPERKTAYSAGYDFEVAEDIMVPPSVFVMDHSSFPDEPKNPPTLTEMKSFLKAHKTLKPVLVPTGIKCKLADDEYLELSVRSSLPLNSWLMLGNGVGIIDSDYYNNPDNEGHIFFQLVNMSPFYIQLKKGDRIGQGIIHKYITVEDDAAAGAREGGFGSTNA